VCVCVFAGRGFRAAILTLSRAPTSHHITSDQITPHPPHAHLDVLTQRVHHADAHPVEPPADLVAPGAPVRVAKLAARVQHGEHRLQRRLAGARVDAGGDASVRGMGV